MRQLGILLVVLLSLMLHFLWLGQEGLANLYYAAGVKSMLMNWHNFFFVSFDPGGFITIDKPPLGFWLQTLSAKIFGFRGWSIILPQALGGVISVYLLYLLVKRYHDERAGLLAALALALTPIFVAASRNNTIDVLLVMTLLFSVYVFLPATEELSASKLSLAFFLLGVGFNIKSLEAFMILPAFYITYFFTRHGQFRRKIVHLLAATMVLIISCLPWFIAVDSVSPEERPYVGSSETNSELDLAIGYNGLGHFLGYGIRTPGRQGPAHNSPRPAAINGQAGMKQAGGETGSPGPFRLFNHQMGGQISWLLPLALSGLIVAIDQFRRNKLPEKVRMNLLFWSCWLIPQIIFFSIAQGAHRYYLVMLAPAIAVLAAISYGIFAKWWLRGQGKKRYLLPGIVILTVVVQAYIIAGYNEWRAWMLPAVAGSGILAVLLLGWLLAGTVQQSRGRNLAVIFGMISILLAPFAWSLTPVLYGSGNAAFPFAGPDLNPRSRQSTIQWGMNFSGRFTGIDTNKLEEFLMTHRNGEKYIIAVPNAHLASPIILNTGQPVITYGGFLGSEKILTGDSLAELVAGRQVRYIMIGIANSRQPDVETWAREHGTPVPDVEWKMPEQGNTTANGIPISPRNTAMKLYDLVPDSK